MNILDEIKDKLDRLLEAQQEAAALAAKAAPEQGKGGTLWLTVDDLHKIWKLDRRTVDGLVKAGVEAGVVRTRIFTASRNGRTLQRIEAGSFDTWLAMGGADAAPATHATATPRAGRRAA